MASLSLLEVVRSHARSRGSAPAARAAGADRSQSLSYGELVRRVDLLSTLLVGRVPGSTVMVCYPNRPEYLAAFLGVLDSGGTLFPVAAESSAPEIESAARRSSTAAVITSVSLAGRFAPLFNRSEPVPDLAADAVLWTGPAWPVVRSAGPALLLQTSGTTSRPKLVRRDGRSLDAVSANMVRACKFTADDRVLAAVPLCHSYGLEHGLLAPMWAGSSVEVLDKFDLPLVLRVLRSGGITLLPGVPFMFDMLCQAAGEAFPALRRVYSAGGPLPAQTADTFHRQFGLKIGQVYGATEIGSVTFNDPDAAAFVPAAAGSAMDGVSIKILDPDAPRIDQPLPPGVEGRVAVAAPSMLSGYLDEPTPLVGGHFLTGDLGVLDSRGVLTLTGRQTLLIDVGGRKVNPAEIEAVLRQHRGVGACVVVPMRLSDTVCRLRAVVVPASPEIELSAGELRRFMRERVSGYKVPRVFEIRPSLPTGPSGKVQRHRVEAS